MVADKDRRGRGVDSRGGDSLVTGHLLVMISIGVAVGILILIGVLFFVGINATADTPPPTLQELGSVVGKERAVQTYAQLREERYKSIRDLLQLMVIALAVPLLAILLGYFSERQPKTPTKRADREPSGKG